MPYYSHYGVSHIMKVLGLVVGIVSQQVKVVNIITIMLSFVPVTNNVNV